MKKSIIFLATMLIWTMSSCVSADKRQVSNMNGIDNQLIGDGNVTWILDKERTTGSLGNDPDSDCVQAYQFGKGGSGINQCIGNAPDTRKPSRENSISWGHYGSTMTINGQQYDFIIGPDHCFISLVALKGSDAGRNLVFRREPQPAAGCKD